MIKKSNLKKKLSNVEMLKLSTRGVRNKTLAAITNTSSANISQRLSGYIKHLELLNDPEKLSNFIVNKSKILTATEQTLLDYMTHPETLKKASVNNLAYAYGTVAQQNRAEQGKGDSQNNVYINIITASNNSLFPTKHITPYKSNSYDLTSDKAHYVNLKGQEVSQEVSLKDDRGGDGGHSQGE